MKKKVFLICLFVLIIVTGIILLRWNIKKKNDPYATFIVPRLEISYFEITEIKKARTSMNMIFIVDNPSPFGIHVDSLQYAMFIAGEEVMKSTYAKSFDLNGNDSGAIVLPVIIENQKLLHTLKSLEAQGVDSVNYEMRSQFYINLPFLKNKPREVTVTRYLPLLILPKIKIEDIKIEKAGFKSTNIIVTTRIINKNNFSFSMKDIYYKVQIKGDEITEGEIDEVITIPAMDSVTIKIPVEIKVKEIATSLPDLIFNKDDTEYSFYSELKIVADHNSIRDSKVIIESEGNVKEITDLRK
ncbi:MAG: LEA type 2 family protein [Chitinophagales bacterium]